MPHLDRGNGGEIRWMGIGKGRRMVKDERERKGEKRERG